MMDLAAISAFVAVGDLGGFRLAGAALGMTSSGVSKAVARLESRLGIQLLARTTRSVRLTPAGKAFHARCKDIVGQLADAEQSATAASTVPQGKLTISITSTGIVRSRVLPVIADFIRKYPQVEVEARISDRIVELVDDGIDLAIRIGHLPDSGLIARRIGETRMALCGSPAYFAAAGVPVHPDDLTHHRFVGFVTPGTMRRYKYRFLVDNVVRVMTLKAALTVDDGDAMVAAGLEGVGLIMVADYLVDPLIRKGELIRVLRPFEMPAMPISLVHAASRHLAPATRVLIGMLQRHKALDNDD